MLFQAPPKVPGPLREGNTCAVSGFSYSAQEGAAEPYIGVIRSCYCKGTTLTVTLRGAATLS